MRKIIVFFILSFVIGCASRDYDKTADWTAEELYLAGKKDLSKKRYETAITYFKKIEARFPYGAYAQQAGLELAFSQWKHSNSAEAIATCDRFIREHPKHVNVDYAYYLKGFIYLSDNTSLFSFLGSSLSETDPTSLENAFETFRQLITLYPDSKYSPDAQARMRLIVNTLAEHEANIAKYYFRRGYYVAAVGRAENLIKLYPETPAIEAALEVLVESYSKMGLEKMKMDVSKILKVNFPKNHLLAQKKVKPIWKFW